MKASIQKTIHDKAQDDFQRWADAMRIMRTLRNFQIDNWNPKTDIIEYTDEIKWTAGTIGQCSGIVKVGVVESQHEEEARVTRALMFLVAQQWVLKIRREYLAQIFGLNEYEAISNRPEIDSGAAYLRFRDEALTGMNYAGKRSTLAWAALPSGSHANSHINRVEDGQLKRCMSQEYIHKIALDNNCTDKEAIEMIGTGEIHRCSRCGQHRRHHRDRKRWQSSCIICRKIRR